MDTDFLRSVRSIKRDMNLQSSFGKKKAFGSLKHLWIKSIWVPGVVPVSVKFRFGGSRLSRDQRKGDLCATLKKNSDRIFQSRTKRMTCKFSRDSRTVTQIEAQCNGKKCLLFGGINFECNREVTER